MLYKRRAHAIDEAFASATVIEFAFPMRQKFPSTSENARSRATLAKHDRNAKWSFAWSTETSRRNSGTATEPMTSRLPNAKDGGSGIGLLFISCAKRGLDHQEYQPPSAPDATPDRPGESSQRN